VRIEEVARLQDVRLDASQSKVLESGQLADPPRNDLSGDHVNGKAGHGVLCLGGQWLVGYEARDADPLMSSSFFMCNFLVRARCGGDRLRKALPFSITDVKRSYVY
jgi:hypothetical protein